MIDKKMIDKKIRQFKTLLWAINPTDIGIVSRDIITNQAKSADKLLIFYPNSSDMPVMMTVGGTR